MWPRVRELGFEAELHFVSYADKNKRLRLGCEDAYSRNPSSVSYLMKTPEFALLLPNGSRRCSPLMETIAVAPHYFYLPDAMQQSLSR